MEILGLLLFIALIAVIFGVSMHDAFWGLMMFIGCLIIGSILMVFIKAGAGRIIDKIAYLKTPEGKAAQKKKRETKINEFINSLFGVIVVFNLLSPLFIIVLLTGAFKDFTEQNPFPTALISMAPFLVTIVALLIKFFDAKKRTKSK